MNENDKYLGKVLDERYEILEKIGEGGMAVVYKAMCHRLNRLVAVKIMREEMARDEEFRRRFCAESQAVAMLSHPNIVAVYDVSHSDDEEYIVMELVEGITLKQYMDKRGALDWKEVVHFSKQISKALSHAHERGIIHRDIKPHNIMLLRDGTIKVGDFGIAALENEMNESNEQTVGSIHYIAPEQAHGESPDARSDVYSLGVVMYEMLTARLPYEGETLPEISLKFMGEKPALPHTLTDNVPEGLERIVMRAMDTDIHTRYQTAKELLTDMDAFIHSRAGSGAASDDDPPPVMPVRSVSELSRKDYSQRRTRARKVTFMSGMFGALFVAVFLFVKLWNFWLGDVFSEAQRIDLPNFVGSSFSSILSDSTYKTGYNFNVVYAYDENSEPNTVISQYPVAGRSVMITPDGISVTLTVNSGSVNTAVPDVVNKEYREARRLLEQAGFTVEIFAGTSESVTKDYVIITEPSAGTELSSGTTVYMTVSSGPQITYVDMPNLIGLSEDAAIAKLENANLSYGGTNRETNDNYIGTVIGQSINAFSSIEEHTKVYLTVSSGPNA